MIVINLEKKKNISESEDEGGSGGEEVEVDFSMGDLDDYEDSGSDYLISREANNGGFGKKPDSNNDSTEQYNNDYNDNSNGFEDPSLKSRVKRMGS